MILLIDDTRNLAADVICRNAESGVAVLQSVNGIAELWLDHDLGHGPSGYDVIRSVEPNLVPDQVVLVTSNPVGRDNIGNYLVSIGFKKKTPELYTRQ